MYYILRYIHEIFPPPTLWNCKEVVERYSVVCISKDAEGQVLPSHLYRSAVGWT